nr:histidine kinase [uncultured Holophaga sp.]
MRAVEALGQLKTRLMSPYAWIAVATFSGMSILLTGFVEHLVPGQSLYAQAMATVGKLVGAIGYGFFSPLPWQWSGDDREHCGYLRGILQSVVFSIALFSFTMCLDLLLAPHFAPDRHSAMFLQIPPLSYLLQIPLMSVVGLFILRGELRDRERLKAQEELSQAQWILLREQMSPHVLFNTLNALAELARRDPEATERALLDLSDLMEQILHFSGKSQVSLARERKFLAQYLSIHSLRFGDRLQVEWDWDPALHALTLPPVLIQPLVENAIKHGIGRSPTGGRLRIGLHPRPGGIRIDVANTGVPPGPQREGATGLGNLRERLRLAYGGRACFRLEREGEWTHAILDLPEEPWT